VIAPENWQSDLCTVNNIVEKPKPHSAPSNFGVIGRYVLSPAVFAKLRQTKMDNNQEIQLTDALKDLIQSDGLQAVKLSGQRFDCGSQEGFVMANLHVAMKNKELKEMIQAYLANCE